MWCVADFVDRSGLKGRQQGTHLINSPLFLLQAIVDPTEQIGFAKVQFVADFANRDVSIEQALDNRFAKFFRKWKRAFLFRGHRPFLQQEIADGLGCIKRRVVSRACRLGIAVRVRLKIPLIGIGSRSHKSSAIRATNGATPISNSKFQKESSNRPPQSMAKTKTILGDMPNIHLALAAITGSGMYVFQGSRLRPWSYSVGNLNRG